MCCFLPCLPPRHCGKVDRKPASGPRREVYCASTAHPHPSWSEADPGAGRHSAEQRQGPAWTGRAPGRYSAWLLDTVSQVGAPALGHRRMCSMEPAEGWGDSPGYQHRMGTQAKGCLLSPLPPTSYTDGGWPLVGTQTSENPATGHMCSLRLRVRRRIGPELTGVSPEFETHPVSMSPPWTEIQGSERVWAGNYGPSSLPVRARWLCPSAQGHCSLAAMSSLPLS